MLPRRQRVAVPRPLHWCVTNGVILHTQCTYSAHTPYTLTNTHPTHSPTHTQHPTHPYQAYTVCTFSMYCPLCILCMHSNFYIVVSLPTGGLKGHSGYVVASCGHRGNQHSLPYAGVAHTPIVTNPLIYTPTTASTYVYTHAYTHIRTCKYMHMQPVTTLPVTETSKNKNTPQHPQDLLAS